MSCHRYSKLQRLNTLKIIFKKMLDFSRTMVAVIHLIAEGMDSVEERVSQLLCLNH